MRRLIILPLLLIGGCTPPQPAENSSRSTTITIPSGTVVPLRLATSLHAGREREGAEVLLVVDHDVKVNNELAIPKGTTVQGFVSQSRSEGTLSGLMNRPARLAIKVPILTIGGSDVPLELDSDDEFEFDRSNTSTAALDLRKELEDPRMREILSQLVQSLDSSNMSSSMEGAVNDTLREIAESCGLTDLAKASTLQKNSLQSMMSDLSSTQGIARLAAGGDLELALSATSQLIRLGESAADRLGKSLKGRTIRAPIGMEIEARTVSPVTLTVPSP